jgi:hypothetical protein
VRAARTTVARDERRRKISSSTSSPREDMCVAVEVEPLASLSSPPPSSSPWAATGHGHGCRPAKSAGLLAAAARAGNRNFHSMVLSAIRHISLQIRWLHRIFRIVTTIPYFRGRCAQRKEGLFRDLLEGFSFLDVNNHYYSP